MSARKPFDRGGDNQAHEGTGRLSSQQPDTPEVVTRTINTPDELDDFWCAHRRRYPYAAKSGETPGNQWIEPATWIFSRSKEALVRAVCQWDTLSVHFEWRVDGDGGYWELVNLPFGLTEDEVFNPPLDVIDDPAACQDTLAAHKLPRMFEHWQVDYSGDVRTFAKHDVVIEIKAWRNEVEERGRILSGDLSNVDEMIDEAEIGFVTDLGTRPARKGKKHRKKPLFTTSDTTMPET